MLVCLLLCHQRKVTIVVTTGTTTQITKAVGCLRASYYLFRVYPRAAHSEVFGWMDIGGHRDRTRSRRLRHRVQRHTT